MHSYHMTPPVKKKERLSHPGAPLSICLSVILFAAVLYPNRSPAMPTQIQGLPFDPAEQGNAFVQAWLAFRRDLDSMAHTEIHPALLKAWFEAAPAFLVRDAARLATNPAVFLAAVARLAELKGDANRRLIAELQAAHKSPNITSRLTAYRILAGDIKARKRAVRLLESTWFLERMQAAIVLTQAGDEKGRAFLRRLVLKNEKGADMAIRALGRYGGKGDQVLLARALRQAPDNPTLPVALGELAMRRLFPYHHLMLLARDPAEKSFEKGGLYEVWLTTIEEAVRHGVRSSENLLYLIEEMKKMPPVDADREAYRRQLVALANFWRQVDRQITKTGSQPPWPADFSQAMETQSNHRISRKFSPRAYIARVSAQILVCALTGRELGYEKLAHQTTGVRVLTPGASRTMDGNLATAWHTLKGGTLTLELEGKKAGISLWVMNSCPLGGGSKITTIQVRGSGGGEEWIHTADLTPKTSYFQKVSLPPKPARRLEIRIADTTGKEPTCIAEIRIGL